MKAHLVLMQCSYSEETNWGGEEDKEDRETVEVLLQTPTALFPIAWEPVTTDKENYLEKLEELINKSTLIINAIPGMKLKVHESILDYMPDDDDEVRKFVNQLIVEI